MWLVAGVAAGPVEKAHTAMRSNEAVFDGHAAGADVFPAGEVFAVEERLPGGRLRGRSGDGQQSRDGDEQQKRGFPFVRRHGAVLLGEILPGRGAACCTPARGESKLKVVKVVVAELDVVEG